MLELLTHFLKPYAIDFTHEINVTHQKIKINSLTFCKLQYMNKFVCRKNDDSSVGVTLTN